MIGRGRMYSDHIAAVGGRRLRGSDSSDGLLPVVETGSEPAGLDPDAREATASHRLHADAHYRGMPQCSSRQSRRSLTRRRAACRSRSPSSGRLSLAPESPQDPMRVESSLSPESVGRAQRGSRRSIRLFPRDNEAAEEEVWGSEEEGDHLIQHGNALEGKTEDGASRDPPLLILLKSIEGREAERKHADDDRQAVLVHVLLLLLLLVPLLFLLLLLLMLFLLMLLLLLLLMRLLLLYETIQRYCRPGGEQQVCWDGFQWVRKGDSRGDIMFDQTMNATRKARRLHIGQQLRVNRPTEWKSAESNFAEIAGAANVPLLESVAAATAVAETTGDNSSLAKLLESLSEEKRKILADFLFKCPTGLAKGGNLPVELLQCQIQAELLHGQPSRVVRIANPVPDALTDAEMDETLADVLEEVNKRRDVLAALIITQDLEKLLPAAEVGDIYVQFATSIQADICILCRMYDGRPLAIERFNEMHQQQQKPKAATAAAAAATRAAATIAAQQQEHNAAASAPTAAAGPLEATVAATTAAAAATTGAAATTKATVVAAAAAATKARQHEESAWCLVFVAP
ncbi:hypothetical protein Emag_000727 [Eimeria magna]